MIEGEHVTYVGQVSIEERCELMAKARAVICPTLYVEPFGGVAVEAMMCGTPVLSTDWGAFAETVIPGVSGYRFQTLQDGLDGLQACDLLDPAAVRLHALDHYSLDAVGPRFDRWLDRLDTLNGEGWYQRDADRSLAGVA